MHRSAVSRSTSRSLIAAAVVARSLALGGKVLPVASILRAVTSTGVGRYAHADLGDEHIRVYVAPLAEAGGPAAGGAVAVAASTHDVDSTLASVRLLVLLAALVAAAAGTAALALLMRRALRPLGKLARAAAEIERTSSPRRRLPQAENDDEIGRLAQTLNGMLSALERSRDAERRFLADASHELRTPLTALVGNVDYLARHGATVELVAELEEDTRRIAKLADDLLALSREEAALSPDDVVSLDELARNTGQATAVETPDAVLVRGDRAALERAVANLVENARRHGRGTISVDAAVHGDVATLSVSDEGEGLQGDAAEHAFERFWRGSDPGAGSGLGLAIVRATAERHGGRALVQGARFTIELPRLRDLSETPARTDGEEPEKGSP